MNDNPKEKTELLIRALEELEIPAIFNSAFGGLEEPRTYDQSKFLFLKQVPYEWIFPKVYAVIHHGGSGTTHLAVKYGCVSMIVPHIIDQFLWNNIISNLGLGPKGLTVSKIKLESLERKIKDLYYSGEYDEKVRLLSSQMKNEQYEDQLYGEIVAIHGSDK